MPDLEQRLRDAAPDRERMPRDLEARIWAGFVGDAGPIQPPARRRRHLGRPLLVFAVLALLLAGAVAAVSLRRPSQPARNPATQPPPSPGTPTGIVYFAAGPDSDHMAFYMMAPDGSGLRRVIGHVVDPQISPDGTRLLYGTHAATGGHAVAIQPVAGGRPLVIPERHGNGLWTGPWSPDGSRIAFDGGAGIYTFRAADGGDLRRVTRAGRFHDFPIAYSPDGTRILFARTASPGRNRDVPMNLYVVGVDGSGPTRINPQGTSAQMSWPTPSADWSPDGLRVAYVASDTAIWSVGTLAVFVTNADGTGSKVISRTGALFPTWSPDGNWIGYDVGPGHQLFVSHPDGTDLRQLTGQSPTSTFTWAGRFSPDSRYLLVQRGNGCDAAGCDDLWIAAVDGAGLRQLTHRAQIYQGYAWLPSPTAGP